MSDGERPTRSVWTRVAARVRDAWLVLGVSLALFLVLEAGYRVQATARAFISGRSTSARDSVSRLSPYADSAWYREFLRERARFRPRWEPYVYARGTAQTGRYLNVDSAGLRVVPRHRVAGGTPARVFVFGGATTWGNFERDSATRAAVLARKLAAAGFDAEVTNFGQPGYTSSQELITLALELRRGNVPDAAIFWDGIDDINAMRQNGRAGLTLREFDREEAAAFDARRRANGGSVGTRLAIRSLLVPSALFTRIFEAVSRSAMLSPSAPPARFCRELMADWLGNVREIERLAQGYDFVPLVIWQPQWETSGSPRSAYERMVEATTVLRPSEAGLNAHHVECARVADSLVAVHAAESIRDWSRMHFGDTATVYLNQYSHTTERAIAIEGDSLAVEVINGLRRKVCSRRPSELTCRRVTAGATAFRP